MLSEFKMAPTESVGVSALIFDAVFLMSALDNLSKVFLKVCDKKSSTVADKSEFDLIKNNILETFKSFDSNVSKPILTDSVQDKVSSDVLAKLDELSNQFLHMKQEMNDRFEKFESSKKSVYNYAAAVKSSDFQSPILPSSKTTSLATVNDPSSTQSASNAESVLQAVVGNKAKVVSGKRPNTSLQVYVLDARNHGDSEQSDCWNFDVNAQDVVQFMDDQGIHKAIFVGHSMGGISAIKVAFSNPDRVEKVVIEEIFVKTVTTELGLALSKLILSIESVAEQVPHSYDFDAANQYVTDHVYSDPLIGLVFGANTLPFNKTRYFPMKQGANGGYSLKINIPVALDTLSDAKKTMTDNVGTFNAPALFIYGTESPLKVFDDALNILNHFPRTQFLPILGSSHEVHANIPQQYAEYILQFIL